MRAPAALLVTTALAASTGAQVAAARPADERPRWTRLADAQLARTEVAAARVGRFVYVVGGFEQGTRSGTAAVERYDIRRDRWTRVADLPVALHHAGAAAYRGRVYVAGGFGAHGPGWPETDSLYEYDPRLDAWRSLAPMPTARGALAVAVAGGRLYAVGGAAAGGPLATVEAYSFGRRRWSRLAPLTLAREHLAAVATGGRVYALGGRAHGLSNFARAEVYDRRRRRWTRLPDMRKARSGIAAAAVRGRAIALGGEEEAGTIREVEEYLPRARRWRRLPDMPTPRHGLAAVARRGRLFAIQGGHRPGLHFTPLLEVLRR